MTAVIKEIAEATVKEWAAKATYDEAGEKVMEYVKDTAVGADLADAADAVRDARDDILELAKDLTQDQISDVAFHEQLYNAIEDACGETEVYTEHLQQAASLRDQAIEGIKAMQEYQASLGNVTPDVELEDLVSHAESVDVIE